MYKERVAKWDNAKAILIFLVVLGHFCEPFCETSGVAKSVFLFVYTFHMPAFIFISGLFCKGFVKKDKFDFAKIVPFLVLAVLLNFFRNSSFFITKDLGQFKIFNLGNIAWFLFALAVFYSLTYALKKINPKYILLFSVVIACIAGYDKNIGSFLSLSRIFAFFPFFFLGYMLDGNKVNEFLNKKYVRCASAVIIVAFILVCTLLLEKVYWLRPLITGLNPFYKLKQYAMFGGLFRFIYYFVITVIGGAFLSLVPNKSFKPLSHIGTHTLSIYFWHLPVISIIMKVGYQAYVDKLPNVLFLAVVVVSAILITALFSLKPFTFLVDIVMKPKMFEKKEKIEK